MMGGELHDGVVAFRPLTLGRESIVLGRVPVGEIGPVHDPRSRFPVCFRIDLPFTSSAAWMPAHDIDDAHRQVLGKINDWLNAAGLRPNGGAT
jgi:hypothetical protein